jgi:hypothetical protein
MIHTYEVHSHQTKGCTLSTLNVPPKFLHIALIRQVRYKRINESLCALNIYITNKHKTLLAVGELCCCKTKKSKSVGISGTPQQQSMIQALTRGGKTSSPSNVSEVLLHTVHTQ